MQNALFEKEQLENWCKYRIKIGKHQTEARFVNGSFIYEWGVLEVNEVDDYTKIGGFEQWNS